MTQTSVSRRGQLHWRTTALEGRRRCALELLVKLRVLLVSVDALEVQPLALPQRAQCAWHESPTEDGVLVERRPARHPDSIPALRRAGRRAGPRERRHWRKRAEIDEATREQQALQRRALLEGREALLGHLGR
eukprot:5631491-Prymnesium_polylepis.1